MSVLDRFFKRAENTTDIKDFVQVDDVLLKALLKGETIDKEKALSLTSVSSAVDKISNVIATLPIYLYKVSINADDKKESSEITDDKRTKILNTDTGDTLDSFQLKKAIVQDYLLDKGAYVFIEKNKGDFKSIRYIEPSQICTLKNVDPIFKDVKYLINGKQYETYQFLTILRSTRDGASGKSVIAEVSKAIETAYTNILFELGLVKKGGAKKGFLTSTRKLGQTEIDLLKAAWKNLYSNAEESVVVLNEGLEFKESSNSSVELQLNERKQTLKEDIKDIFHIDSDYGTFIKDAVMPIITAIETALNKNFLLESEKDSFYFAFDTKEITKGDDKSRAEYYKTAITEGWMNREEVRYAENLNYVEGLDVFSFSLADVLYNPKTKTYFTPNTGVTKDAKGTDEGGEE